MALKLVEVLKHAVTLTERPDPQLAGIWPRAAAVLGRQVIEQTLNLLWQHRAPALKQASTRAQLLCLPQVLDPELAKRVDYAWWALSDACHHRGYEIGPTATELRAHLDVASDLMQAVGRTLTA